MVKDDRNWMHEYIERNSNSEVQEKIIAQMCSLLGKINKRFLIILDAIDVNKRDT